MITAFCFPDLKSVISFITKLVEDWDKWLDSCCIEISFSRVIKVIEVPPVRVMSFSMKSPVF